MHKRSILVFAALMALVVGMPLSAKADIVDIVTFDNIIGTWSSPSPGDVGGTLEYVNNGTQHADVYWGDPAGQYGKSGYQFDGIAPPPFDVELPPDPSDPFQIGTFTHVNRPIYNPPGSIDGITLSISMDVSVNDVDQGTKIFVFDFGHWETNNADNPCADGGANGVGVNENGCADRVTFETNLDQTSSFWIGDTLYTITLAGFSDTMGGTPLDEFWTKEDYVNLAYLYGIVETWEDAGGQTIPEPTSLILLGTGLGALGLTALRRKK